MNHPPIWEMVAAQTLFTLIAIACAFITWRFWLMKDGIVRVLIIMIFASLTWSFGIEWIYYLIWDFRYVDGYQSIWVRLIKNTPLCITLIRFLIYVWHKID